MASSLVDVTMPGGSSQPLTIITKTHSSQAEVSDNIRANMKRDPIRFMQLPGLLQAARRADRHCRRRCPSLNRYADKIKTFRHVMVCGSAHDHLVSLGIVPTFALAGGCHAGCGGLLPQSAGGHLLSAGLAVPSQPL